MCFGTSESKKNKKNPHKNYSKREEDKNRSGDNGKKEIAYVQSNVNREGGESERLNEYRDMSR